MYSVVPLGNVAADFTTHTSFVHTFATVLLFTALHDCINVFEPSSCLKPGFIDVETLALTSTDTV